MPDPLSTLGAAASILQLIDYGSKFVANANEIREGGSTTAVRRLRSVAHDLSELTTSLRSGPTQSPDADKSLSDIVDGCLEVADELLRFSQTLTLGKDSHRLDRMQVAVKTLWKRDKMEELAKTLGSYQQELSLRVLIALKNANDHQHSEQLSRLSDVQKHYRDIVEVISINQTSLLSKLDAQERRYKPNTLYEKQGATWRQQETVAAILTFRNGKSETISRPKSNTTRLGKPLSASRYFEVSQQDDLTDRVRQADATLNDYDPVVKQVLDALFFRQITDRKEEVALAHKNTFQWMFQSLPFFQSLPQQKPWSNFTEWLETGNGCYWISGKAGSGKSTLMKFLQQDARTEESLSQWAGQSELRIVSFYFWYLGSTLQNSHIGLLRSLLFDLLDNYPYLAATVFPGLCRSVMKGEVSSDFEPSFSELKKAFFGLLNHLPKTVNVCWFIDGIDEFAGDISHLLEMFSAVEASTSFKIVLSSRPTAQCTAAFSRYPKLRLQDLTFHDIELYVRDELCEHPNMRSLQAEDDKAASVLITEITTKASGVFLWVRLVVRSLLQGLDNFDRIVDMKRRLAELPSDLEHLYDHMLKQLEPRYRVQAAMDLQITLRSTEVQQKFPLDILQMSFAGEDPRQALTSRVKSLSNDAVLQRNEATEARIRSRCCGLLEVQQKKGGEPSSPLEAPTNKWRKMDHASSLRPTVGFLHKSVADFLRLENVWQTLQDLTAGSSFDVNLALLSSCVQLVKSTQPLGKTEKETVHIWTRIWEDSSHGLKYAQSVKQDSVNFVKVADELGKALRSHLSFSTHFRTRPNHPPGYETLFEVLDGPQISSDLSFISWAGLSGATNYVREKLRSNVGGLNDKERSLLLTQMVFYNLNNKDNASISTRKEILDYVISCKGLDPNLQMSLKWSVVDYSMLPNPWNDILKVRRLYGETQSAWTLVLLCLIRLDDTGFEMQALELLSTIIEALIKLGADLHAVAYDAGGQARQRVPNPYINSSAPRRQEPYLGIPAFAILEQFFTKQSDHKSLSKLSGVCNNIAGLMKERGVQILLR